MANLDYYAQEVDALLRQVPVNRNNIGMTQVNVLPIPEGDLECITDTSEPITFTAIGDKAGGKVCVEISGESDGTTASTFVLGRLTRFGRGENDTGIIMPGRYSVSFTCSMTAEQLAEKLSNSSSSGIFLTVAVSGPISEGITVCPGETRQITIPENFTEVRVFGGVEVGLGIYAADGTYIPGQFGGDVTFDIYPFLRLQAFEDEPFEPYKPDLQTQINDLAQRVAALERGGGGGGVTLITRSIDSNGTYRAEDDNADGYYRVDVEVPEDADYNETQYINAHFEAREVTNNGN